MFDNLDEGQSGSEGPWISWTARGTQDGEIDAKNFYMRDKEGGKTPVDLSNGVVLDPDSLKTGWQADDGGPGKAPTWVWGDSPSKLPQKPGDNYKKGFQMRLALSKEQAVTWQQAGAGAWNGLLSIKNACSPSQAGKLPVVKMTGARSEKFSNGMTTQVPVFELVKWVDRPDVLAKDDAPGGFDEVETETKTDGGF